MVDVIFPIAFTFLLFFNFLLFFYDCLLVDLCVFICVIVFIIVYIIIYPAFSIKSKTLGGDQQFHSFSRLDIYENTF